MRAEVPLREIIGRRPNESLKRSRDNTILNYCNPNRTSAVFAFIRGLKINRDERWFTADLVAHNCYLLGTDGPLLRAGRRSVPQRALVRQYLRNL